MTKANNPIIIGTGSCLPEKKLTNSDLEKMIDTDDKWITTRTGIKERHIAGEGESNSTFAICAAQKALKDANVSAEEIDMIILATVTPEMVFPATACFVQDAIGAKNAWAFDITAACSGFVYGLSIAEQFIKSGKHKNILVIGSETLSKITNYKDRGSCILFGDGAGAAVIQGRQEDSPRGVMYSKTLSDGTGWNYLKCEAYGSRYPSKQKLDDPDKVYMQLDGKAVYQLAVRRIVEMVDDCKKACNVTNDQIKFLIPHQMNARIIESAGKRLGFDESQIFVNIKNIGNTSAASIPIALDDCRRQGKINSGDIVLLAAFGGGLTWGANIIEF